MKALYGSLIMLLIIVGAFAHQVIPNTVITEKLPVGVKGTKFTVVNKGATDNSLPSCSAFRAVGGTQVDVSTSSKTLTFEADCTPVTIPIHEVSVAFGNNGTMKPMSGGDHMDMDPDMMNYGNQTYGPIKCPLKDGSTTTYVCTYTFPRYAEDAAPWILLSLNVTDETCSESEYAPCNRRIYTRQDAKANGWVHQVSVISTPDYTSPMVTAFSIEPKSLTIRDMMHAEVTIKLTIRDPPDDYNIASGVASVYLHWRQPNTKPSGIVLLLNNAEHQSKTNPEEWSFKSKELFGTANVHGTWSLEHIKVWDVANNMAMYMQPEFQKTGWNTGVALNVESTKKAGPVITEVRVESPLNITGKDDVTVTAQVIWDGEFVYTLGSGCAVSFKSTDGHELDIWDMGSDSAVYNATSKKTVITKSSLYSLSPHIYPSGDYMLAGIVCIDEYYNMRVYGTPSKAITMEMQVPPIWPPPGYPKELWDDTALSGAASVQPLAVLATMTVALIVLFF